MFLSAFAALRTDPASRTYYERKRAQGKRPGQAILALAHRRILWFPPNRGGLPYAVLGRPWAVLVS